MNGNDQAPFDPRQYISGRVKILPSVDARKSKPFFYSGSTGSLASGASAVVRIQIHDDSHFLVEAIQAISSLFTTDMDKFLIQATDDSNSQTWSNLPVPLRDFAGNGVSPKYLADPNILRPTSTMSFKVTNNSGSTANVYIVLAGRKIYGVTKEEVDIMSRRLWYQYVLNVPSLAASVTNAIFKLQIYSESDFVLKRLLSQQLQHEVLSGVTGALDSEVLIQVRDTGTDEYLFSDFVPTRAIFGTHQAGIIGINALFDGWTVALPFALKKTWLVKRNGILDIALTNDSTTAKTDFNLVFEGIRIFDAR